MSICGLLLYSQQIYPQKHCTMQISSEEQPWEKEIIKPYFPSNHRQPAIQDAYKSSQNTKKHAHMHSLVLLC